MVKLYDRIGQGYADLRRPDPRIASTLKEALGDAGSILNVGAGTGGYEPCGPGVLAVEPARTMIEQRSATAAPVIQATAERLPFAARSFDAALAILTVHHWADRRRGLEELARVARRRVVILTWDPAHAGFWLVQDYFPEILAIDRQIFPGLDQLGEVPGRRRVVPVLIPHDCSDGFLGAYWRRPEAYLDPAVRRAISTFSKISMLEEGLERLRRDLRDGTWEQRYGCLRKLDRLDLGYRIVVAEP